MRKNLLANTLWAAIMTTAMGWNVCQAGCAEGPISEAVAVYQANDGANVVSTNMLGNFPEAFQPKAECATFWMDMNDPRFNTFVSFLTTAKVAGESMHICGNPSDLTMDEFGGFLVDRGCLVTSFDLR